MDNMQLFNMLLYCLQISSAWTSKMFQTRLHHVLKRV